MTSNVCFNPGKSLLWVSALGIIIIYLFALVAFAFFRGAMNPQLEDATLYSETLFQCLITVLRYGLIGDMFEVGSLQNQNGIFSSI